MSIFKDTTTGKATREMPAVGSLTGRKDPPPTDDRGVSVRHVPNAKAGR
jgi:hypothetical protein